MLCADLKTGKHLWEAPITADVISAPILNSGKAYFSCQDGTSFCLDALTGTQIFKKADASTSAPTIAGGKLIVAQKATKGNKTYERLAFQEGSKNYFAREAPADYLATTASASAAPAALPVPGLSKSVEQAQDASVGFATAPATAELEKVASHIPVKSVVAGWAYQGSRAAYSKKNGAVINAQGKSINLIGAKGAAGGAGWVADARGKTVSDNEQVFSPPAVGKDNIYLVSGQGNLLALDQNTGSVLFDYATGKPTSFQPALANGNMYVGTSGGMLICLKTGLSDADGWSGWGGNAQHNKE
jgi:outer membrane protein assembly factor BamB